MVEHTRFDRLTQRVSAAVERRAMLRALGGLALAAASMEVATDGAPDAGAARKKRRHAHSEHNVRGNKAIMCVDGVTKRVPKKKRKTYLKQGATRGECQSNPTCVPTCPAGSCNIADGCGGQCPACPSGRLCAAGVCQECDVLCAAGAEPLECGDALRGALATGGTVYVCPGRYAGPFFLPAPDGVSIIGAGDGNNPTADTILDGLAGSIAVVIVPAINATYSLTGMRITGAASLGGGGGILQNPSSTLNVTDCTITGNTAGFGGGIWAMGSLSLSNTTVSQNTTLATNIPNAAGAGILIYPTPTGTYSIADSVISGNTAAVGNGGGIFAYGAAVTITGTEISGNIAMDGGGVAALAISALAVTIDAASSVTNNTATGGVTGGGLAAFVSAVITVAPGATVSGNTSPQCSTGVTGC